MFVRRPNRVRDWTRESFTFNIASSHKEKFTGDPCKAVPNKETDGLQEINQLSSTYSTLATEELTLRNMHNLPLRHILPVAFQSARLRFPDWIYQSQDTFI